MPHVLVVVPPKLSLLGQLAVPAQDSPLFPLLSGTSLSDTVAFRFLSEESIGSEKPLPLLGRRQVSLSTIESSNQDWWVILSSASDK